MRAMFVPNSKFVTSPRAGLFRYLHGFADVIEMTVRKQDVVDLVDRGDRILTTLRSRVKRVRKPWNRSTALSR